MNKNGIKNNIVRNKNKIDILNIITEFSNNYKTYNDIYTKNLLNLTTFYENLALIFETLPSKIIFPDIETNQMFKNNPSINIINKFYNYNRNILKILLKISGNIKNIIIPKLTNYKTNLEKENSNLKKFLSETFKKLKLQKEKIEEANNNYNLEADKFKKLELDSIKKLNNSSLLSLIHKNLNEQRKKVSNFSFIQQQEISILNRLYNENQNEMSKKIIEIKSTYKNDNFTIFECIKEYLKIFDDELLDYSKNEAKKLNDNIDFEEENQKPDEFIDIMLINDNNKKIFFNKWKYEFKSDFDIINEEDNNPNNININSSKIPTLPFTEIKYEPENMFIINDNQINENQKEDFLSNLFISLRKKEEIKSFDLTNIINTLEQKTGKINFYQEFCDKYLNSSNINDNIDYNIYMDSSLFEFTNFSNMAHFKTFINNILENISSNLSIKNNESFDLLDKIIIIGEKTFFENTYLCSLLNKNKIFKSKNIWEDCIKFKILNILNLICEENKPSNNAFNSGFNSLYNKGSKLLGTFLGKEQKPQSKKNNLIEYLGLNKYLTNYETLSEDKKIILNKNQASSIIYEVFKVYIMHMANYDYSLEDSINVIYSIYNYYQFNDNYYINYFLTYNNIYYYSCKNNRQILKTNKKKEKNKEKIKDIKDKKSNINYKYPTRFMNEKSKIILLKNIFVFLNNKEKIQLITLNKQLKNNISKKIYKYLLKQKNTPVKTHMEIWKIFLNFKKLKEINKNMYENFKKEMDNSSTKEKYQKIFKIIEVDINRTEFIHTKQKGLIATNNILKSLQLYNIESNYCQGMNYMAAYLYQNTLNEEDSFYIILGLFTTKKFSSIFQKGMSKLKTYFTLMDKLIYLYIPKIYFHFKKNQIVPDFFLSPYFITLFTHIYPYIQEKDNIFILRVWDDFIINGWKSIFEVILALIKIKEKYILSLEGDELVDYLVNKINKDDIFRNKNYDKFELMKKNFVVTNELINYIEEEIKLGMKIKKKLNYQ